MRNPDGAPVLPKVNERDVFDDLALRISPDPGSNPELAERSEIAPQELKNGDLLLLKTDSDDELSPDEGDVPSPEIYPLSNFRDPDVFAGCAPV